MGTNDEIEDEELEKIMRTAKEKGDELSAWIAEWRETELGDYPREATLTACLTASLVPTADLLTETARETSVGDAVWEASNILRGMLQRRTASNSA